jgi:hypothetical protein
MFEGKRALSISKEICAKLESYGDIKTFLLALEMILPSNY